MLGLKNKIFGDIGFSADMKLTPDELNTFRQHVSQHWLSVISQSHPELADEAKHYGIEKYHLISDRLDHSKLWSKCNRVLPRPSVEQLRQLPFLSILKNELGEFNISDVVHTEQIKGYSEIYWRLVRPNVESDIGPLHKDKWFHDAFDGGYGMFPKDAITVKIWIPLYCEPGKSGLALAAGSHRKTWNYHIEVIDGVPKPRIDDDISTINAELIPTDPGNMLIFNENLLHGGAVNKGNKTRVSVEITMVFEQFN